MAGATLYPSAGLWPSAGVWPALAPAPVITRIREPMPLRLAVSVDTPGGLNYRWGIDEPDAMNVPAGISLSSTMPGGFESFSCTLPRKPGFDYPDLGEFSTITAYGAGERVAWQGRLETAPRTSGDQLAVVPGAVGWQAALEDNSSARMVYVAINMNDWVVASTQRRINVALAGASDIDDGTLTPDPISGQPSLLTQITIATGRTRICEMWYDAKGVPLDSLYYAWKLGGGIDSTDTAWSWVADFSADDLLSPGFTETAELRGDGPGNGTLQSVGTQTFARVRLRHTGALTGTDGTQCSLYWTMAAVYGAHGLTKYGPEDFTTAKGLLASDIVQHAVRTWAPSLSMARGGQSTIEQSAFIIPHLVFLDPTTAAAIVKAALAYEMLEWWVDEGPTFNLASRENHGQHWRARVGPSGLQETGPSVDRMFNRVLVAYQDVSGATLTVGPTGSGASTIDDSLADPDPMNPVTFAGLVRYPPTVPNIGTGTADSAAAVGRLMLAEIKQASTSGQAQLVGYVLDGAGISWPAWMVRAGDWVSFVDAHDTSERRIVRAQYDDSTRSCRIDLDSPPEALDALLAEYGAAVASLGFA